MKKYIALGVGLLPVLVWGLTDGEASQKNLDSVFIGTFVATWKDKSNAGCGERNLGTFQDTVLKFGPKRDATGAQNSYYVSLTSPESKAVRISLVSSVSTNDEKKAGWDVGFKKGTDGYSITGNLVNEGVGDNSIKGTFDDKDTGWCGIRMANWNWNAGKNTTYQGFIKPGDADFKISGESLDKDTQRTISYEVKFTGKWLDSSAKLKTDKDEPTWEGLEEDKSSPTGGTAAATKDTTESATGNAKAANGDGKQKPPETPQGAGTQAVKSHEQIIEESKAAMAKGHVVGIAVGALFGAVIAGIGIFMLLARRREKQKAQVYPELAYIYAPSPEPSVQSGSSESGSYHYDGTYKSGSLRSEYGMREVMAKEAATGQARWKAF
ncbi:hypothetical protein L873DRAFT_1793521 [Choiromyces venosus 120613-1]|uniref:Concanavalin A-like lectin/glucanase n=1 Tax=Choiromyces venosus 120613-1 TaxID=1336337 RepID=A0A3N4J9C5_9PEZI|nr:hypothetical protein L873DRAFT_1793521 [Choiromyces venosus 120613-1]